MTLDELMAEACRLATESATNGWGGPFGAVVATLDGKVVGRGQNRVLQTGDVTAHAEIEAIRDAARTLNGGIDTIAPDRRTTTILALGDPAPGAVDGGARRARMLAGHQIVTSGSPCPMCMGAIYWARLEAVWYANDLEAARSVGFDDAEQYDDLCRPVAERRLPVRRLRPDLGLAPLEAWRTSPLRHPY